MATDRQVGGNHYLGLKIQPMELSLENDLNAAQHTAIKYIMRYQFKGGIEDLRKAIHTLELLIEWEERYMDRCEERMEEHEAHRNHRRFPDYADGGKA